MLLNEINYVYGLPAYITKIDPKLYEKEKILSQIEKNYKVSKVRNKWDVNSFIKTDIHHSAGDDDPRFKKINYYSLPQQYEKIIADFFNKLALRKSFKFTFVIANYTCAKHNSVMTPHIHTDCTFSLIHYISFDERQHTSTIFRNPYYFNQLLPHQKSLQEIFANQEKNGWLYKEWVINTEEDDIAIVPAVIEHYVRNFDSEKSRITIVVNISINAVK